MLAGESLDTSGLGYDFDVHHVGAMACGPEAAEALRRLAAVLDRSLLLLRRDEETAWAWLGGRQALEFEAVEQASRRAGPPRPPSAVGEPGKSIAGWRLSHRQAQAALPIALRTADALTRYADVALLASVLQDDLLVASLRQLYLVPLEAERDGGEALRETLRAYFAAERNVSSAAATLGVSRRTVASRLHAIEERFGCPLGACAADAEAALRLQDLNDTT